MCVLGKENPQSSPKASGEEGTKLENLWSGEIASFGEVCRAVLGSQSSRLQNQLTGSEMHCCAPPTPGVWIQVVLACAQNLHL